MIFAIFHKHPQIVSRLMRVSKFGIVGLSGVVVNSGLLYLLTEKSHLDYKISSIVAIEISIINNFIWNTLWTWSDKKANSRKSAGQRFAKFQISTALIAIVNYATLIGMTEFLKYPYLLSNLAGIVFGSTINFLIGHFWIFKHEKNIKEEISL